MDKRAKPRQVQTSESGQGTYGQTIMVGRHRLTADEPEALGGRDTGPDPYQLVLAGLCACTAMTIRMYAQRKGWPLKNVAVSARHLKLSGVDWELRDRFDRTVELAGELTPEQRRRLLEIADHCPVSQTLQHGSEVTVSETPLLPIVDCALADQA